MVINGKESMKTIFSRMQDIKLGGTNGFLDDGVGVAQIEQVLDKVGVKLKDSETNFRDMGDVLNDLALRWKNLNEVEQAAVAKSLAGTRQRENFLVLMNNWNVVMEMQKTATESSGLALDRYGIYLESTEAKANKLKASIEGLWSKSLNSSTIQGFIEGTTGIINFVDSVGGLIPILNTVLGLIIAVKAQAIGTMLVKMGTNISFVVGYFGLMKQALTSVISGTLSFRNALVALNITTVSLATFGIGALVLAITGLVMAQNRAKQKHEEYIQSLQQEVSDNKSMLDTVDGLKTKYKELSEIKGRTAEQNKELLSTQAEIIKNLQLKHDAIDGVNKSLEENSKVIDEAIAKEIEYNLTKQKDVVDDATKKRDDALDNATYNGKINIAVGALGGYNQKEAEQMLDLVEVLKEEYGDLISVTKNYDGTISKISFDRQKMSAEELVEALKDVQIKMRDYKSLKNDYDDFSKSVGLIAQAQEEVNNQIQTQVDYQAVLIRQQELQKYNAQDIASLSLNNLKDMQKDIKGQIKVTTNEADIKAYKQVLNDIESQIQIINGSNIDLNIDVADTTEAKKSLTTVIEDLSKLQNIYSEFQTNLSEKKGILPFDVTKLEALRETFGDLGDTFEDFENLLLSGKATAEEVQGAFDDLTTAYIMSSGVIDDLTTVNRDLIISQLELQGVQNAGKVITKDLAIVSEELIKEGKTLSSITLQEANDFIYQSKCSNIAKTELINFKLAKIDANSISLMTDGDIENLINLIRYLGGATTALRIYQNAKAEMQKGTTAGFHQLEHKDDLEKNAQQEVQDAINKAKADASKNFVSYSPPQTGKKSKSGGKEKYAEYLEQDLEDAISIIDAKGDKLVKQIELLDSKIEQAIIKGDTELQGALESQKTELLDKQLKTITESSLKLSQLKSKWIKELQATNLPEIQGYDLKNLTEEQLNEIQRIYEKKIDEATRKDNDKLSASLKYNKEMVAEYGKSIIAVNNKISQMGHDYLEQQVENLQNAIDKINDIYDRKSSRLDAVNSEIEIQQILLNEEGEAYKALQEQKYQNAIQARENADEAIQVLRKKGLSDESEEVQKYISLHREAEKTRLELLKQRAEKQREIEKKTLEESLNAINDLLEITIDMLKKEYELQKKNIKAQIDGYKEIIEARKEALQLLKDEHDYQKGLEERQKKVKDVQDKLSAMQFDDKNIAQRKLLEEELVKAQENLYEYQYDNRIDKEIQALDDEFALYEKQKQKEIDVIDEMLDQEGLMRQKALKLIEGKTKEFYDRLLEYNRVYGDGCSDTISKIWENAQSAIEQYGGSAMNVLDAIANRLKEIENAQLNMDFDYGEEGKYVGVPEREAEALPVQETTKSDTKSETDYLLNQQKYLHNLMVEAKKQGNTGLQSWVKSRRIELGMNPDTGEILKKYHTGIEEGLIGGESLQPYEQLVKVAKGEGVFTPEQMSNLSNVIKPITNLINPLTNMPKVSTINNNTQPVLSIEKLISVDRMDNNTDLNALANKVESTVIGKLKNSLAQVGMTQRLRPI
jgi:hypothetical protein